MEITDKKFFSNYGSDKEKVKFVKGTLDKIKESGYFIGQNNINIYYEKYCVDNEKGRIVISHGFCECLDKFKELIYYFIEMGYSVYAIEHRGHGRSGCLSKKNKTQVNIDKFQYYIEDLKTFLDKIVVEDGVDLYLYAHSILGGLLKKKAVCDGIAKLFKYLLNVAGIKCIVVIGNSTSPYSISDNSSHSWNIVKIDNTSYHIDVTWDLSGSEQDNICYDYYCLTDAMIQVDHTYKLMYPACIETFENYFEKNRLIVNSENELQKFITNQITSVPKRIYCKVNYNDNYDTILNKAQNYAIIEGIKYKNIVRIKSANKAQRYIIDFWVL